MTCLLKYSDSLSVSASIAALEHTRADPHGIPSMAILGAGSFTEAVHLPNLRSLGDKVQLKHLVCRTGHKAHTLASRLGAAQAGTDWKAPLADPGVNCVLIGTRHDLHASMALESLKAGKHVLVEKPLALTRDELSKIRNFFSTDGEKRKPILLTGFNRRFSPAATRAKNFISKRSGPVFIQYRMNAGFIPHDHWVHGPEGGGRNLGEACHIYDLFVYLVGSTELRDVKVAAVSDPKGSARADDNFVATFEFIDGSVATLSYTSLGNPHLPKEHLEAFFDNNSFTIMDYKESSWLPKLGNKQLEKHESKGHLEELMAFMDGMKAGKAPIALSEQFAVSEMAFSVQEKLTDNKA